MSWRSGTYGLQGDFGRERPPLWPKLAAVVILLAVAALGVRACRNLDRETIGQRQALVAQKKQAEPEQAIAAPAAPQPQPLENKLLPESLRAQVGRADKFAAAADFGAAFEIYQKAMAADGGAMVRGELEARIGAVAFPLAVSRQPMAGKVSYTIQRGDSVSAIARRFGVTQEYLLRANGLSDPNRIVTGRDLRTLDHPAFTVEISKSARTLVVALGGRFFKRYRIGVGCAEAAPTGTFVIRSRIVNPAWWRADGSAIAYGDPENILGTRWLGLEASGGAAAAQGCGIHGTWDDTIIGRATSAGSIRLRNGDVEELHLLLPLGTPVCIRP